MTRSAGADGAGESEELMTELGFYTLAGHSDSPRDLVDEVRLADELGLGAAFISERFNLKDAPTLCGAAAAASERIGIATAATNHNTRHPLITATFATTMHRLTGGRFTLGLGRGFDGLFRAMGLPPIRSDQILTRSLSSGSYGAVALSQATTVRRGGTRIYIRTIPFMKRFP